MSAATAADEKVKVLVVDDSEDLRVLLKAHFEHAGCEVTLAASAEDAIEAYATAEHDLAVIDLILPGMNGWALTERMRLERPHTAVAITSVLDSRDYPQSKAVLPKPVSRASVRDVLMRCVPRWVAP
ncbi:response regulator [Microbacterium sp. STN6]|uniref:response regulator n=1 Tax=Microbacterium sp. STN6 TaxID=2995588 RepID=UPI002260AD34|nr:response regulator [Microbacterium sp. STN6]MCX7522347.1 response regulator [Microbacterium sp. STN6]